MQQSKPIMRLATPDDVRPIFELSNDSVVRQSSFHPAKINYTSHKKWFYNKVTDQNVVFLVALMDGMFAGQVRFEIAASSEALISLSVVQKFRGMGIGSFLITEGIVHLREIKPEVKKVIAYIKSDNESSLKLFKKNGFVFQKDLYIAGREAVEYELSLD